MDSKEKAKKPKGIGLWVIEEDNLEKRILLTPRRNNKINNNPYQYIVKRKVVEEYFSKINYDFRDLANRLAEERLNIAELFSGLDKATVAKTDKSLRRIILNRVSFATEEAYEKKTGLEFIKEENKELPEKKSWGAYFKPSEGSVIPIDKRSSVYSTINLLKHEFAGHEMDYLVGNYKTRDQVMREVIAIFIERRMDYHRGYYNDPHKIAASLLTTISKTTYFGKLNFADQWRLLKRITNHETAVEDIKRYLND